jgi:hypothetical protein
MPDSDRNMTPERRAMMQRIQDRIVAIGTTPRQVSLDVTGKVDLIRDLKRMKGLPDAARMEKLANALGVSLGWLLHGGADAAPVRSEVRGAGLAPQDWASLPEAARVPLLGSALGGEFDGLDDQVELTELHLSEVLDHVGRPPSLAGDEEAYAVTVVGDSMAPRFEPGERAFVSPRAGYGINDDVIVQLRAVPAAEGSDEADRIIMVLIKRLVRRTAAYVELRQFNPDMTFRVPRDRVAKIHRVMGRL